MTERAGQQAGLPGLRPATHRPASSPCTPPIRLRLRQRAHPSARSVEGRSRERCPCCRALRASHRRRRWPSRAPASSSRFLFHPRCAARTGDVHRDRHWLTRASSELAFEFLSTKIMRKENMPMMDGLIHEKSFKEAVLAFDGRMF